MIRAALLLLLASTAASSAAAPVGPDAAPVLTFRSGAHQGYGRAVLDVPTGVIATASQAGDRLTVRLTPPMRIEAGLALPPNVRSIAGGEGVAELTLAPSAQARTVRIGDHFVIDIRNPAPVPVAAAPVARPIVADQAAKAVAAASAPVVAPIPATRPIATPGPSDPAPVPAPSASPNLSPNLTPGPVAAVPAPAMAAIAEIADAPVPGPAASDRPSPTPPPSKTTAPAAAPPPQPAAQPSAMALRAEAVRGTAGAAALAVPFAPATGAAAFRRGSDALVVFDERAPIDLSGLTSDPAFRSATIQLLPEATVLRLALPADQALSLTRDATHWIVEVSPASAARSSAAASPVGPVADGRLALAMTGASRVVAVADPSTGGNILVGTVRAPLPVEGVPSVAAPRRLPGLVLPATWLGAVVEPLSDRIAMRALPDRFVVSADPGGLELSGPPATAILLSEAAGLTRSYEFPAEPVGVLAQLVQTRVAEAAAAPPLSRAKRRREAAEAMVALGLDAEADGLLRLTVTEDPRAGADPAIADLDAIASLLAGRLETTGALGAPRAGETSERQFWRAARDATLHEGSAEAAKAFAATAPLLRAYPPTLRDRLLPLVAETMLLGGEAKAAAALLAGFPDLVTLGLARSIALELNGQVAAALAGYDALAAGRDRLVRMRAIRRATELRLASGAIDATAAARKLDPLIAAWQGDARELDMRLRVASLQSSSGQPRAAIFLLRATAKQFPDDPRVREAMRSVLDGVLRDDAPKALSPLEFAALVEDNADLLPAGGDDALAIRLADKLAALDLTHRAGPVMERVMRASPPGRARAELGARLAAWRIADEDSTGARTALAESDAPADPATGDLRARRSMLAARALAGAGDPAAATTMLALLDGDEAASLRADIAERAHLWPAATDALAAIAARDVPASGALSEQQARMVLRLAAAAAQAGDLAALADARARGKGRMGKLDDMLRLITAEPVRGPGDLPRSARETTLARSVASAMGPTSAAH